MPNTANVANECNDKIFLCALVRGKRKRCSDVTLSRQEGSTTRHLASALVLGTESPTGLVIVRWIGY